MKVLRLVPLVLMLAACSSVNVPISPYRIDVQQGNALEQETVDKLKTGMNRSQVRFLLGTPLLVDPFHSSRWDYVFNFRKAGKLTEQRRLALFFEGDVLKRIEAEGLTINAAPPEPQPVEPPKPVAQPEGPTKALPVEPPLVAEPLSPDAPKSAAVQPAQAAMPVAAPAAPVAAVMPTAPEPAKPAASQPAPAQTEKSPAVAGPVAVPVATTAPAASQPVSAPQPAVEAKSAAAVAKPAEPAAPVSDGIRSPDETSIVGPLRAKEDAAAQPPRKPAALGDAKPEPVALQTESNVEAVKPDVMPEFPNTAQLENKLTAALNAWAEAWRNRNEDAYLAAYAPAFRPAGGLSRSEWEARRRMLLRISRNIDLRIEGVTTEGLTEDRAQVSFRQFYRSDTYQDAVRKQLNFVRIDDKWLIEEENVLGSVGANR